MGTVSRRTHFGPPRIARVLYFLSGGLSFATAMQAPKLIEDSGIAVWLAVFAMFSGLGLAGLPVSTWHQRRQQRRRDSHAAAVLRSVQAEQPCRYSLYLRGFATTGKDPQIVAGHDFTLRGSPEPQQDMEAVLAEAMEPTAPLIALGDPGEQIGAGRVRVPESEWETDFQKLAADAETILLRPSDTPGTLRECEWIVEQGLWDRTVLLMPLENTAYGWAARWASAVARLRERGVELPSYRSCGMLFKLDGRGTLAVFRPIGHAAGNLGPLITELAAGDGLRPDEDLIECSACGYSERRTKPGRITCQFCKRRVG